MTLSTSLILQPCRRVSHPGSYTGPALLYLQSLVLCYIVRIGHSDRMVALRCVYRHSSSRTLHPPASRFGSLSQPRPAQDQQHLEQRL
jgi:hypothetical protein